jgi:hypothetical protein
MSSHVVVRTATVLVGVLILAGSAYGQETTNTNCTLSGNTANCTSNTTDYGAQQQRSYEEGQEVGSALGQGIGLAMQRHSFSKGLNKYCAAHPGAEWHYYSRADGHLLSSGHCPSEDEKAEAVANEFLSRHKDFIPEPANSKAMIAYMESHKLNPLEKKSYDHAYKALKKASQLDLYAK